jgi:hypothetical protein
MTSRKFDALFEGTARRPESRLTQREMDIGASIQTGPEEIMLPLGVELIVLALPELRDLAQDLRIANLIEPEHTRTTSSRRARGKIFRRFPDDEGCGREHDAPDERTAFEKELEFTHRQPHDTRVGIAPQTGEAALRQALGVYAEAGAIPEEDLGACARRVHEQAAIAGERITAEALAHECAEAIEALAQIRRGAVGQHGDLAGKPIMPGRGGRR